MHYTWEPGTARPLQIVRLGSGTVLFVMSMFTYMVARPHDKVPGCTTCEEVEISALPAG